MVFKRNENRLSQKGLNGVKLIWSKNEPGSYENYVSQIKVIASTKWWLRKKKLLWSLDRWRWSLHLFLYDDIKIAN